MFPTNTLQLYSTSDWVASLKAVSISCSSTQSESKGILSSIMSWCGGEGEGGDTEMMIVDM